MRIEYRGFIITRRENDFGGEFFQAVNSLKDLVLSARTTDELITLISSLD